jgi:hypothetical protein
MIWTKDTLECRQCPAAKRLSAKEVALELD